MNKKSWIVAMVAGILSGLGIGVGIKKHRQKKQIRIDEERHEQYKRDRLISEIQKNQMALQESQQEILTMLEKMRAEMDPNDIKEKDVAIEEE